MSEQPTALPQAILDALACSRFLRRQLDSRSWLAARLALSIDAPLDATALRDFLRDEKIDDNNAGGNQVLRYGMAREQILGLGVVLSDGRVL